MPYHYILTGAMLSGYDGKGKLLSQTNLFGAAILEDPGHSNAFIVDTGKDKLTMQVGRTVLRFCFFVSPPVPRLCCPDGCSCDV